MIKKCATCSGEFDTSKFYKNKNNKDGLNYDCKPCCVEKERKDN